MVNKIHYQLDNKQWLKEQLLEKDMTALAAQIAQESGIPCERGSIAWACKDFTTEDWKQIKFARQGKKIRQILEKDGK